MILTTVISETSVNREKDYYSLVCGTHLEWTISRIIVKITIVCSYIPFVLCQICNMTSGNWNDIVPDFLLRLSY